MRSRRVVVIFVVIGGLFAGIGWLLMRVPFGVSAEQTVLGSRIDWPQVSYVEVRGYFYNADGDPSARIIENGLLHKTVINREGVLLNASQIERLLDAVARPHSDFSFRVACYFPRHAFIFFDEKHDPVATVDICFSCFGEETSPGVPHRVGHAELQRLCQDLSLPFFAGRSSRKQYQDYATRYAQADPPQEESRPSTTKHGDR